MTSPLPGILPDRVADYLGLDRDAVPIAQITCGNCNGDGTVTTERAKQLGELTRQQLAVLFEAEMYREGNTEEQQKKLEKMKRKAGGGHGTTGSPGGVDPSNPNVHVPSGTDIQ